MPKVVIVGAGLAGASVAATLRQMGFTDRIMLIGDEAHAPYQRPPLSKAQLIGGEDVGPRGLRGPGFWEANGIELIAGRRVESIEREERRVRLDDGRRLRYDELVLATGARNRVLPGMEGALSLRSYEDSAALRTRLQPGASIVVIGGGFIGLEVAAAARARDANVTVVEALDRVMARVASKELSLFVQATHERAGTRVLVGRSVGQVTPGAVVLADGEALPADTILVGIGIVPNDRLAAEAGLEVDDGIVVDEWLRTSDPAISAVGDCASYPCSVSGARHRLESVQNATDQGRTVGERLAGSPQPHRAVPWFWSDQYDMKLRIAGVVHGRDRSVVRGDITSRRFSIGRFLGDRLAAVESVNNMPDHTAARRLLASVDGPVITATELANSGRELRDFVS